MTDCADRPYCPFLINKLLKELDIRERRGGCAEENISSGVIDRGRQRMTDFMMVGDLSREEDVSCLLSLCTMDSSS
ncbi:hypothetical protein NQZ68_033787 [Dissostichus eleginoides]|nr:hypothetical protein NQZ68_033787 [Dissostichus eleginoides]